ncbi:MAG: hypothetical protein LBR07_08490 [Puniceicoccales bacterium]|jgi:dihydrofolate synthase/folylpolyglutamate synthase|nr:hypothetical protein [Puniceicoccales bacterium]
MTHDETLRRLFALKNHGSKFGVERMALLAAALGHPERAFPSVHIAGSNGKGSTAAMLEQIFRDAGLRTGLYTSPHLVRLGERAQVNREALSDAAAAGWLAEITPVAERLAAANADDAPSFFEFMTALAFLEFRRRRVDVAVVETGLGGRLDATNILAPAVSVITSISVEHAEYLGGTVAEIAAEKGGIIKARTPVVLGVVPPEAERVLREIARDRAAPVVSVAEHFGAPENFPQTNLAGAHQRANAAAAVLAASLFFRATGGAGAEDVAGAGAGVPAAFAASLMRVNWPARWQEFALAGGGRLIVDAAHNAECAGAVEPLVARIARDSGAPPVVVTGVLGAERARPLLAMLARHAREIHLVRPAQERACDFADLEACLPAGYTGSVVRDDLACLFPRAGECALAPAGNGSIGDAGDATTGAAAASAPTILVIGSVYLAGEVLARFQTGAPSVEGALQDALPALPAAPVAPAASAPQKTLDAPARRSQPLSP